jgi:hypothetical protein
MRNDRLLSDSANAPSNFVMQSYQDSALLTWKTPLDTTVDSIPLYGYSYGVYLGNSSNSSIFDSTFQWAKNDLPFSSVASIQNYTYSWPVDLSSMRYYRNPPVDLNNRPVYIRLFSRYISYNFGFNQDPRTIAGMINAGWYRWNPNNDTANPCAPNILSATGGDLQAAITWSHPTQTLLVPGISLTLYGYVAVMYVDLSTNIFFSSRQISATETSYTFGSHFPVGLGNYKARVYALYSPVNINGSDPAGAGYSIVSAPSQTVTFSVTNNF